MVGGFDEAMGIVGGEKLSTWGDRAMSNVTDTPLPPQLLRTIDPVCDAFERAWKQGERPVLEDRLGNVVEAVRSVLLAELIRIELEWRFRRGEQPSDAEYRTRFPSCADRLEDWLNEAQDSAELLTSNIPADTGAPDASRTGTYVPAAPSGGAAPPRVLGEYDVLERLGGGGMGEVYKARHRRLDKLVALKLLPVGSRHALDHAARFLREMKTIGGLDHVNVVEAHDAGEQSGVVYLVMKLVEGVDLSKLVRQRGPLPVAEACELARQAALGLQYLHERGLVHRDIKPSNLMRTPDGVVKILDLGLARWRVEAADGEQLTEAGQIMGTPDFLAPEQARSAADADIRADLYGLGATLFYLLTGRAPFAHRQGIYEKLEASRAEKPPDVRSLRPEVPAALAALLDRLLAKRPEDRPRTPKEVAAALAELATTGTETVREGKPVRIKSRRRWLTAGVCGLMVLGVAGILIPRNRRVPEMPLNPDRQEIAKVASSKVRVLSLEIKHFANIRRDGSPFDQPRGVLGKNSFAARRDDSVTVEGRLSRPAYAFLISFRPDGTEEVCFPENEDEAPPLTDNPRYPSVSRGVNYGLNEGEGLQLFALVVSSKPLPSFKTWRARLGASPWRKSPAPPGVVWRDDGTNVEALTGDANDTRGKGRQVSGKTPVVNLMDWLRQAPEIDSVAAVGFAVLPKNKP